MRVNQPTVSHRRRERLPILILLLTLTMTACGGAYSATNTGAGGNGGIGGGGGTGGGAGTGTVIADNWQLVGPPAGRQIGAALNLTNSTITGSAHINDGGPCYAIDQGVSLSGTIDPHGNVSVTSSSLSGQVLTFTGVLDSSRSSISLGNYAFTGGCADGESGALTGVKFIPVTGNYSGTLGSIAVTANLTQSPSIVGTGSLHVTGTVTYSSPTCSEVFTITDSELAGEFIQLSLTATDGTSTTVYGRADSQASQLFLADYDGSCGGGGVGTLLGP